MGGLMPQLVPRDELQKANALMSLVRGGLTVLGPNVAALLVVTVGAGWALFVDAITWFAAAALLLRVRVPRREQAPKDRPGTLAELREGWEYFRRTTWLWIVVLAFCALNAIHSGAMSTLGPVVAKATIGEQGWGLALSAQSAGILLTTAVMLRFRLERPRSSASSASRSWGCRWCCSGHPQVWLVAAAMLVAGAGVRCSRGLEPRDAGERRGEMLSRAYSYALGSFVACVLDSSRRDRSAPRSATSGVMVAAGPRRHLPTDRALAGGAQPRAPCIGQGRHGVTDSDQRCRNPGGISLRSASRGRRRPTSAAGQGTPLDKNH
jgi:MFS family permease